MLGTGSKAVGGVKYSIKRLKKATAIQIKSLQDKVARDAAGGGVQSGAVSAVRSSGMGRIFLAVLFGIGGIYLLVKSKRK